MVYNIQSEPYVKRLPSVIDRVEGIQTWGLDNLYPQRAWETRDGSYTAKSGTEVIAEFTAGMGWELPMLANTIVNEYGETWNDLLMRLCQDDSVMNSYAFHIKYNLKLRVSSIQLVEVSHCRFGVPDNFGNHFDIKTNNNWERDPGKMPNGVWRTNEYPIFNPNPEVVKKQFRHYGFRDFPGQLYFVTPKRGVYPKSTIDPVLDHAQAQQELGIFDLASIQNGFTATTIIKWPGTFKDEEEKEKAERKLAAHKGARGAKSTLVIENPGMEDINLTENIQMQSTDKMFESVKKDVRNAVRENLKIPPGLMGTLPEGGMFNQQQLIDEYNYMNAMVKRKQMMIGTNVKKIMSNWKIPMHITSYNILPKKYI